MSIEELNDLIEYGDINEFIRVCEARQCKVLSKVADVIAAKKGVRVILIAGASSAGKTTTAKRLCTQLRVNGLEAIHCSTDDYFVGDARNPRGPDGEFDYETIEAVDMARLAEDVNALLAGEPVYQRRFDFVRHEGYDSQRATKLAPGGCLVIEGIHALNPKLTAGVPDEAKYRIFVEPKTQLEVFAKTTFDISFARLLRRLVRDNQFRKLNPIDTFHIWPKVLAGEEKCIKPFRSSADVEFDSALLYEMGVLKFYVAGLLQLVLHKEPDNIPADHLRTVLEFVLPISPTVVPGDSILRETIGSSQLEY